MAKFTLTSSDFTDGGTIATTHSGKWVGALDSKKSIAGLTAFKKFFQLTQSKSTATLDG